MMYSAANKSRNGPLSDSLSEPIYAEDWRDIWFNACVATGAARRAYSQTTRKKLKRFCPFWSSILPLNGEFFSLLVRDLPCYWVLGIWDIKNPMVPCILGAELARPSPSRSWISMGPGRLQSRLYFVSLGRCYQTGWRAEWLSTRWAIEFTPNTEYWMSRKRPDSIGGGKTTSGEASWDTINIQRWAWRFPFSHSFYPESRTNFQRQKSWGEPPFDWLFCRSLEYSLIIYPRLTTGVVSYEKMRE